MSKSGPVVAYATRSGPRINVNVSNIGFVWLYQLLHRYMYYWFAHDTNFIHTWFLFYRQCWLFQIVPYKACHHHNQTRAIHSTSIKYSIMKMFGTWFHHPQPLFVHSTCNSLITENNMHVYLMSNLVYGTAAFWAWNRFIMDSNEYSELNLCD